MMKFIDEYGDQLFWSELSNKLALRDALKEILKAAVETIKKVHPYEKPVINAMPVLTINDI